MSLQSSAIQSINKLQSKTETSLYYGLSPPNSKTPKQQAKNFYIPIGFTKCSSPSSLSGLSGSFSEIASINKHSSSLKTPVSQKRDSPSPKRISLTKTTLVTASQKCWSVKTALTKDSSPSRLSPDLEISRKPKNFKRNELKFQPQNNLSLMNMLQKSQRGISNTSIERPSSLTGRKLSPASMMDRLRDEKINQLKLAQNLSRYKGYTNEEALSAKSCRSNRMTFDNSLRKYLEKQKGAVKKNSKKMDSERQRFEESDVFENKSEVIREPENKLSILIEDHWRPTKINKEDFPKSSSSIGGDSNQESTPKSSGLYAKVRAVCERNVHVSPKNYEREKIQQVFEFYNKPDIKLISRNVMGRRSGKLALYKNEALEDLANQDKTCFPCSSIGKAPIYNPKIKKNFTPFSTQLQQPFILIQDNNNGGADADANDKNSSARFGGNQSQNSFGDADLNTKIGDFSFQKESEDEEKDSLDSFQNIELLVAKEELEKQNNNILISNVEHSFC